MKRHCSRCGSEHHDKSYHRKHHHRRRNPVAVVAAGAAKGVAVAAHGLAAPVKAMAGRARFAKLLAIR